MELAGVTRDTKSPAGGEILKDAKGEPTGLFRETADGLLDDAYEKARQGMKPEEREAEVRRQIQLATEEALSKGVTSFQDAGSSFETIDVFKKVAAEGKLGAAPLGDDPRRQRAAGAAAGRLPPRRRRRQAPHRPRASSTRSTARSARAARGCSSPTRTCPRAPG